MVKQARAVRTRRAVLEAAAHVIGSRGYQAATMAEIIQRAGVTKGAVYFHFTSKGALARAVITEQADPFLPQVSDSRLQDAIDFTHRVALALRSDPLLQAGTRIAVETTFSDEPLVPYQAWTDIISTMFGEARDKGSCCPVWCRTGPPSSSSPPIWACSCSRAPRPTAPISPSASRRCGSTPCRVSPRPARWAISTRAAARRGSPSDGCPSADALPAWPRSAP
ncbi:TetR family transcriptional regulator [Streptomyces sirii]|uniref:TetR family transcriptional regulator n=1 Tax=Streptomyces sirii TaxID=3127701 RepID=UPI003D36FA0E